MLKRLGHETTTACNGLEAVKKVQNNNYDIVLMDMQMPIMDGVEATKRIRAIGYSESRLPILALTASVRTEEHDGIGISGWLTKPLRAKDLKQALADFTTPPL